MRALMICICASEALIKEKRSEKESNTTKICSVLQIDGSCRNTTKTKVMIDVANFDGEVEQRR